MIKVENVSKEYKLDDASVVSALKNVSFYPAQFDKYITEVRSLNKKCIFSYDENQYLRDREKEYNTKERIEKELLCNPYNLTNKIRTNKEIAYFIKQLFDIKKNLQNIN